MLHLLLGIPLNFCRHASFSFIFPQSSSNIRWRVSWFVNRTFTCDFMACFDTSLAADWALTGDNISLSFLLVHPPPPPMHLQYTTVWRLLCKKKLGTTLTNPHVGGIKRSNDEKQQTTMASQTFLCIHVWATTWDLKASPDWFFILTARSNANVSWSVTGFPVLPTAQGHLRNEPAESKTPVIKSELKVWYAAQVTRHFMLEEDREKNEVKWIGETELLAVGEARKAIFWSAACLAERTFDGCGFLTKGIRISASVVPHCELVWKWKRTDWTFSGLYYLINCTLYSLSIVHFSPYALLKVGCKVNK